MPLISIKRLAYERSYNYAPPVEEALVNTDDVVAVVATEARGSGPFVRITLRGLDAVVALGTPEELLDAINALLGRIDGVGVLRHPNHSGAIEEAIQFSRNIRKGSILFLPTAWDYTAGHYEWDFRIEGGDPGQVVVRHEDAPQPDVVAGEQP